MLYGIHKGSGKVLHANSVKRGMACDCVCPECGSELVSHQGVKRGWHFKHYSSSDSCSGHETGLHLRAKEIIASTTEIRLPFHDVFVQAYLSGDGNVSYDEHQMIVSPDQQLLVDPAQSKTEVRMRGVTPDVLLVPIKTLARPLAVEVAVTHFANEEKVSRFAAIGLSAVEYDLSEFVNHEFEDNDLIDALLLDGSLATWLHNVKADAAQTAMEERALNWLREREKTLNAHESFGYINSLKVPLK